jgi:hypothetical protein
VAAVLDSLFLKQADEQRPPGVVDAPAQPRPGQPRHSEVFDGDRLVLADQPQGELVVVVGPPVADLAMADRDPMPGLDPVGRSLALVGQRPLGAGQAPLSGAQEP